MQYKYAIVQQDHSDFSSGRVFYSLPGHPAFPVRLASEIFQRCVAHRQTIYKNSTPCTLYDPCCGTAYQLSVLGYLHGEQIREIIGSDIDERAVASAKRNLGLLHMDGLDGRIRDLSQMLEEYGKDSHRGALKSADILKRRLLALREQSPVKTNVFKASATDSRKILNNVNPGSVDIVFTDVPYGQHSQWRDPDNETSGNPIGLMLGALHSVLSSSSVVAISSDKKQKVLHEKFQRIEQFQVGKRRVVILKPI